MRHLMFLNRRQIFALFLRAFSWPVHCCSSASRLSVLPPAAASCIEMEKPTPPVVRSLDGSELKNFAVPEWAWPYFRSGPYTLHELPPADACVGRTRTISNPFMKDSSGSASSLHRSRCSPEAEGVCVGVSSENSSSGSVPVEGQPCEDEPYFHLLHDVLMHPGAVETLLYLVSENKRHLVVLCSVGRRLCGHKGIVHGGFTATLLDNTMGLLGHAVFPRTATKTLNVRYLRPFVADTEVIVDAVVESIGKRSCLITATVVGPVPQAQEGAFPTQQKRKAEAPVPSVRNTDDHRVVRQEVAPLPPLEEGLWVVATGSAEMVDVSAVWAGL